MVHGRVLRIFGFADAGRQRASTGSPPADEEPCPPPKIKYLQSTAILSGNTLYRGVGDSLLGQGSSG